MSPKAQAAEKSTSGKATGGGHGSGRTDTRGDSSRRKTTVFKTNSIGNSTCSQATARSVTMEVENRAGEGYPAQALLKMFYLPVQRAKLIAFLKQEEPTAMQSGWDWQQDNSKSTALQAQMVSLLTLMAANNNSAAITPEMLPVLCQSLGLPVPASTSASSASSASSSSLPPVSDTTGTLAQQIQTAITAAFSARDTGNSSKSLPPPAAAGTRSTATLTKIGSSASSALSVSSPSPTKAKDEVKTIAEMLMSGTITFEQAVPACAAAGIEFTRVMQSWQHCKATQLQLQRAEAGSSSQLAGAGPGPRSFFRTRSSAPASVALVYLDSGIAAMDRSVNQIMQNLECDENEENRSADFDLRTIAGEFGVFSDASSTASSRRASPTLEFATEDLDLGVLRFFSRRDGSIARSKVRKFFSKNTVTMGEMGLDIPDIPRHGAGYARDVPEDTMRNAARTCVHFMYANRLDLLGLLRKALADGTLSKGPCQVRFVDSPMSSAGTPASTPHRHRQHHSGHHRPSPSSSSSSSSASSSSTRQNLNARMECEDSSSPLEQRKRKERSTLRSDDNATDQPSPHETIDVDISTDVTGEKPPKRQHTVAAFFKTSSAGSASGSDGSGAASGSASSFSFGSSTGSASGSDGSGAASGSTTACL